MKMSLKELYNIFDMSQDFDECKSRIDYRFNETPTTAIDNSEYVLIKK